MRFPDIEFVTEMNCSDFSLPALTIQPIVENAIKHGILRREEGGRVKVKIYETDSSYFISVKDNGIGFDVVEIEINVPPLIAKEVTYSTFSNKQSVVTKLLKTEIFSPLYCGVTPESNC